MRKIINFMIMLFLAAVLIGCGVEESIKKLDAPVIKTVQHNIVYWGSVDNAGSYVVNIDDIFEQQTTDLNFDLGKVLSESKSGIVKVKAKGNGNNFIDSDWSNAFVYEFVKDNGENNNQETQKQKLATPIITGYANEAVTWNAVENASGYVVRINGVEYNVYTTSYKVSFNESCSFTVQVKAIPNTGSEKYLDSEWSYVSNYQYVKDNGENNNQETQKQKLATPVITGYSNEAVTWNAVENASGYVVRINGVEYNVYTTSHKVSFNESCTFTVQVKAIPNTGSEKYLDSEWSYVSNYQYVKDNGENNNQETQKQKLATPVITGYANEAVTWNAVENASGYIIRINGVEYNVYNTTYVITFDSSCSFTVQVKAIPNTGSEKYLDSEWSYVSNYQYVKEDGGTEDNQNNKGTYLNSGVGSSVNVITADNYSDYIKGVSVLDKELLKNDELFKKDENSKSTKLKSSSSQLIEDFVEKNSITFDVKVGDNNKKKTMFTNISVGLRASFSNDYSSYSNQYYYSLDAYIERYSLYLNDYSVKEKYQTMYSEDYKIALSRLYNNQTEEAFKDFFDLYGTHLIVSGIFGGRLNAYYSTVTNKSTIDETISGQLKVAVERGISAVNNTGVNVDISQEMQKILKTSEFKTAFYASAYGGNTFTATTLEGLNASYENWANSFNDQNYNPVLINYSPNGIIGLWDILPNEYSSMKSTMEKAFINYCDEYYNSLIGVFKPQKGNDYYSKAELLSCDLNNGYDYTDPDPDYQSDKFGFKYDFANFVVKNVGDQEGDSYSLRSSNEASIYLKLVNDCDNLPRGESNTSRYVCTDSYDEKLYEIPGGDIGKVEVGYGLLIVYITYEDGTSGVRYIENDIFEGKKAGEEILIANGIKKACKIEVIICFELGSWAPGLFGISGYYETNYRINETFNFK